MAEANRPPKVRRKVLEQWDPDAWVYIIWFVIGNHVYCKVGFSTDPASRLNNITTGFPEKPYRIEVLPCLSLYQAKIVEVMYHDFLQPFNSESEWFSSSNVRYLNRQINDLTGSFRSVFRSFGYKLVTQRFDLAGPRPVLSPDGSISHVVRSDE